MRTPAHTVSAAARRRSRGALLLAALCAGGALLRPARLWAEPVPVRFAEGVTHGYLTLRTLDGKRLADGELHATHYVLKIEIGGVAGVIAPLVGKQPPDVHVWVQGGTAPAFVKMQGPLYSGGPIWQVQLASPVWPRAPAPAAAGKR